MRTSNLYFNRLNVKPSPHVAFKATTRAWLYANVSKERQRILNFFGGEKVD